MPPRDQYLVSHLLAVFEQPAGVELGDESQSTAGPQVGVTLRIRKRHDLRFASRHFEGEPQDPVPQGLARPIDYVVVHLADRHICCIVESHSRPGCKLSYVRSWKRREALNTVAISTRPVRSRYTMR